MRFTDAEEVERAGVHAERHAQAHRARRREHTAGGAQGRSHLDGGDDPSASVVVTVEPEQKRVAAELQQSSATFVRDTEQPPEAVGEDGRQFLGPDAPAAREALGKIGEAADVGEAERAFTSEGRGARVGSGPFEREARLVCRQSIGCPAQFQARPPLRLRR